MSSKGGNSRSSGVARKERPLKDSVEAIAERYWEELHGGGDPSPAEILARFAGDREALRARIALIRLIHEQRPPDPGGPTVPVRPPAVSEGFLRRLRQAQGGDRAALEVILSPLLPVIREVSRGYERPDCAFGCDLLVQEIAQRAIVQLEYFEPGADADEVALTNFQTWIEGIARRYVADPRRGSRRRRRVGGSASGPASVGSPVPSPRETDDPGGREPSPTVKERIRDAFAGIPGRTGGIILWLHLYDGLPFDSIARLYAWDIDKVRKRYERGVQRLEQEFRVLL